MRSLVTTHITSLHVMLEVLNRASSVFLDSPVKLGNDKNEVLLMNSLVNLYPRCKPCDLKDNIFRTTFFDFSEVF
jgi:hypothetical protein